MVIIPEFSLINLSLSFETGCSTTPNQCIERPSCAALKTTAALYSSHSTKSALWPHWGTACWRLSLYWNWLWTIHARGTMNTTHSGQRWVFAHMRIFLVLTLSNIKNIPRAWPEPICQGKQGWKSLENYLWWALGNTLTLGLASCQCLEVIGIPFASTKTEGHASSAFGVIVVPWKGTITRSNILRKCARIATHYQPHAHQLLVNTYIWQDIK